jgi:hypothetical protein
MFIKRFLRIILAGAFAIAFATCGSSPKETAPDELDLKLREVSDYLNERIPSGKKIAVISVQSDSSALSEYVIDELISNAVNDNKYSVVDRQQLDAAREELNLNLSGEVSDQSAQEVGKFTGAQIIITGRVSKIGDIYRLSIRALEVESVEVQGSNNWNIAAGKTINALMASGGSSRTTTSSTANATTSRPTSTSTVQPSVPTVPEPPAYKIGDTGPAGGLVFYDKGNNYGGWRYLEAAPVSTEAKDLQWSVSNFDTGANGVEVGNGKLNTKNIMDTSVQVAINTPAARHCDRLQFGGFNDWYLPSKSELGLMYMNLKVDGIGSFSNVWYWSSSEVKADQAWAQNFQDGKQLVGKPGMPYAYIYSNKDYKYAVRAIRQFQ